MTVTATTTWSRRVRSPPTTLAPTRSHSAANPAAKSSAQRAGRSLGARQADGERVRAATHRVDVGEVLGGGPVADVVGLDPVAAEVPALDQQVGRDDDVALAHPEHRGVVAGADQHVLALGEHLRSARRSVRTRRRRPAWPPAGRAWAHPSRCSAVRGYDVPQRHDRLTRHGMIPTAPEQQGDPHMVVQAYILIQTDVGKAAEVATAIAQVKGVTMAEDVTGPYDVIVRAEARNVDELGKLVVAKVQTLDGITRTLTCPVVHI